VKCDEGIKANVGESPTKHAKKPPLETQKPGMILIFIGQNRAVGWRSLLSKLDAMRAKRIVKN
jgi:hypothetical protein